MKSSTCCVVVRPKVIQLLNYACKQKKSYKRCGSIDFRDCLFNTLRNTHTDVLSHIHTLHSVTFTITHHD